MRTVDALKPVFLEPRDDYWEIHDADNVSVEHQREYELVPFETARQLKNAFFCEDCFPHRAAAEDAERENLPSA
ncbi:hypothetical protein [Haloarchaeobius amylolyticus]|uniref:hypothetical protein n=1 Tax=Haloarchaeobius amylolyticus TaxID=1198296 RepID=UPI00226DA491|nr:hypothetical protein [Haloarchaeobius amylolyticus]